MRENWNSVGVRSARGVGISRGPVWGIGMGWRGRRRIGGRVSLLGRGFGRNFRYVSGASEVVLWVMVRRRRREETTGKREKVV